MGVGSRSNRRLNWSKKDVFFRVSCTVAALFAFLFLLGVCLRHLPEPLPLQHRSVSGSEREVTLLIWTHPFGRYRELPDCSALYDIDGCVVTDDERAYTHADAVVVHHRDVATGSAKLPPEPRPDGQKWVWLNYESPVHTPALWSMEGVFNLTMSYRADSDIFLPYGYLVPEGVQKNGGHPLQVSSRSRPRLVAWVVSNWVESHARVAFYHELRQHVQVDVFGRAGRKLPEGSMSVIGLVKRYQFYLALENSQHTDYITEKLWNAVLAGAVPVVLGPARKNYERFLPPEAFIHVDDFPTVQGLARYLLMLKRDPVHLMRHLRWRRDFSVYQPVFWTEHYCTACMAVRKNRGRTNVVQDLTLWFES
uniref:alpha-(1,3)-fucosyltransferase 4-like n=1 Tax=Doryrhamphus excisus TaxID=161450 RepID=UPI0025AE015E|nr:alpha-(1,3)-fucosyltransferase 4-like [Doryrhamphus excisus]